eukprot:jgi/Tetstr1/448908/TSEL_036134.t1
MGITCPFLGEIAITGYYSGGVCFCSPCEASVRRRLSSGRCRCQLGGLLRLEERNPGLVGGRLYRACREAHHHMPAPWGLA